MAPPDRLNAFLYRLMHDHLPPGKVIDLVKNLPDDDEQTLYPSPELHALSYRLALKIVPEPESEEQSAGAKAWLEHAPMRILEELDRAAGVGLTMAELASAVGWEPGDDDDIREAGAYVQRAYDAGHVQRDLADPNEPKILLTNDGEAALAAWRNGARS